MEKSRVQRYLEKREVLRETLECMEAWLNDTFPHEETSNMSKRDKFAIFHAYQIIVEAITDIIAMVVKDIGYLPKDDYSNIDLLIRAENCGLDPSVLRNLKHANGLRNRIVHEYNGLVESMAFEAIVGHVNVFHQFLEEFAAWLKQQ